MKCPCGADHFFRGFVGQLFEGSISVSTPDGTWLVPRVYIAAHGFRADELPALAARYGWPLDRYWERKEGSP